MLSLKPSPTKFIAITNKDIVWDETKPKGDKKRLMNTEKAKSIGFECKIDLYTGMSQTIEWYKKSIKVKAKRYNPFTEKSLIPLKDLH